MYLLRCHACWRRYAEVTLGEGCICGGAKYSLVNPTKFNLALFIFTDFKKHLKLLLGD